MIKCYKPAKAVLSIKVCPRVEEKIETFQVSEGLGIRFLR